MLLSVASFKANSDYFSAQYQLLRIGQWKKCLAIKRNGLASTLDCYSYKTNHLFKINVILEHRSNCI